MKVFLGIDWGGTYIKAGIVNSRGDLLKKKVFTSRELKKKQSFIDNIGVLLDSFAGVKIAGIGIGAPGIVNIKQGFIYYLPNIPGWKNYPLKRVLQRKYKLPVAVDNDANVFALAEARVGLAKGSNCAIFLTLGTGLGGAVILNGRVLQGTTSASELGHVPVSLNGKPCSCGGKGCIETFLGNKHLLKKYQQLKKNKTDVRDIKQVFINAKKGEKEAVKVWEDFSQALGMFLSGMINIFNPQKIIIGGGVAGAFTVFKPMLVKAIKKQAMWPQINNLKILRTKLNNPGIIGAGLLAAEN